MLKFLKIPMLLICLIYLVAAINKIYGSIRVICDRSSLTKSEYN